MDSINRSLSMGMPPRGRSLTRQSLPSNAKNRGHAPSPPRMRSKIPLARRIHSEADMQQRGFIVEDHDASSTESIDDFHEKPRANDSPVLLKREPCASIQAVQQGSKVPDFDDSHHGARHVSEISNEDLNEAFAWRSSSQTGTPCWGSGSIALSCPIVSLSQRQSNVPV
eukprot:CAMPEP_0184692130 /NCGR_PEP_ID=MMETSP0313-20130426/739_1 /TAXON_ID=2792 /ORGANISM="Porphyridium aerugineum, Strain SAG 1380-2" /LENGTH=168 /DNA_ID=CAMNT_0027149939 /DNA_START=184 /DNA_END=690 /DNA_ORIENTATION=-